MRERERALEKKPRPRTKNARRPVVAFTVSNGIPAIENRRQKTRRPRSLAEEKKNISPSHRRSISPPNSYTHKQARTRKNKKTQQKQFPAVPVRASVRDGLSERRNRSSGLCGRGKHYACLFVTFAFICCVYISRACARVLYRKKKSPSSSGKVFFSSFFSPRSEISERRLEREIFFLPALNPKP